MYQDREKNQEKEIRVKRRNSYEISVDTHTVCTWYECVIEWMNCARLSVASSAKHFLIFIRCTNVVCAFMTFYTMLNGHLSESEHHHLHFASNTRSKVAKTAWKLPFTANGNCLSAAIIIIIIIIMMVARNEKRIEIEKNNIKRSKKKRRVLKTEKQKTDDEYVENGACVLCIALFCFADVIFL